MPPETGQHCRGHEKSTLAINSLESDCGQLRKEIDIMGKRILEFLTVGSFRWTVGGLVFLSCLAVGANWKLLNNIDENLDTITNKLSYFEGQASGRNNGLPGTVKQISL
jgi:hypothetical protein